MQDEQARGVDWVTQRGGHKALQRGLGRAHTVLVRLAGSRPAVMSAAGRTCRVRLQAGLMWGPLFCLPLEGQSASEAQGQLRGHPPARLLLVLWPACVIPFHHWILGKQSEYWYDFSKEKL